MARTVYRVLPDDGEWLVKRDGAQRAAGRFSRKEDAITRGRALALASQPSQLVIHLANGQFETEWTYGDDPYPPAG